MVHFQRSFTNDSVFTAHCTKLMDCMKSCHSFPFPTVCNCDINKASIYKYLNCGWLVGATAAALLSPRQLE